MATAAVLRTGLRLAAPGPLGRPAGPPREKSRLRRPETRAESQVRKFVGRKTASAAIIASEKNGSPSRNAIERCSQIIATSSTFFSRRLKSVNGKATCTITVP